MKFFASFLKLRNIPHHKSKAKIFKFNVILYLIQRDDFFRANMNNFMSYTEHSGEE